MSNTTISPTAGADTLAGIASAMALGLAPPQAVAALPGIAPTLAAVGALNPRGGCPVSWSALAQGAIGAATPALPWNSARFAVSGIFGSYGNLIVQGSVDNVNWVNVAGVSDPVLPGFVLSAGGGLAITPLPNGVLVIGITTSRYISLRPVVVNGDTTTLLNVSGNIGVGAV